MSNENHKCFCFSFIRSQASALVAGLFSRSYSVEECRWQRATTTAATPTTTSTTTDNRTLVTPRYVY